MWGKIRMGYNERGIRLKLEVEDRNISKLRISKAGMKSVWEDENEEEWDRKNENRIKESMCGKEEEYKIVFMNKISCKRKKWGKVETGIRGGTKRLMMWQCK